MVETAIVHRVSGAHPATAPLQRHATDALAHQAGHSESFLCSIFANLTADLAEALRDAWLASMIGHRQSMRLAEGSAHNRTRQALASVLKFKDDAEVSPLPL